MSQSYNLKPLQQFLFEIYQYIEKICVAHNLRVFAISGTALGAVRHQGFIPWDDDMDVGMPRSDYERFLEIADSELPDWLSVLSWKNCSSYHNLFAKVIVTDPVRVSRIESATNLPANQGVFVDIIPFDGCPSSRIGLKIRYFRRCWYRAQAYAMSYKWIELPHLGAKVGWLLCKIFRAFALKKPRYVQDTYAMHEALLSKTPYESSSRVMSSMWAYSDNWLSKIPKEYWFDANMIGNGRVIKFEDGLMRVFDCYDIYLKSWFANYMELPPVSKRRPMHGAEERKTPWRLGPVSD